MCSCALVFHHGWWKPHEDSHHSELVVKDFWGEDVSFSNGISTCEFPMF